MIEALSPTRNLGGRPLAMTEARKAQYILAIEKGHTRMAAAGCAGVSHDTATRAIRLDEDFAQAVYEAECRAEDSALTTVADAIKTGNVLSAQWWLERRRPQQYGRQERLMVLRALTSEVAGLPDEELRALAYGASEGEGEVIDVEATVEGEGAP